MVSVRPRAVGQTSCCPAEDEDEGKEVEDFTDRVSEQEDSPIEVIGHVAEFGQREQAEAPPEEARPRSEGPPGEERADEERGRVDGQKAQGRDLVDEVTVWHRGCSLELRRRHVGDLSGCRRRRHR